MKQETLETTSPNIIPEKNYKKEVLNIKYFYNLFLKEKTKHPSSDFVLNKKVKSSPRRPATCVEFRKIIYSYLKIYFMELYLIKGPSYFFLGGKMKIVRYHKWVFKSKQNIIHKGNKALGLFWYLRPTEKMHYMVEVKKLMGSTNALPVIEKIYNKNNNKDLLPIFTEEQKKGLKNKTLYRCIQT